MLKDLMAAKNITVKELSQNSKVPYSTVNSLCNGARSVYHCEIGTCQKLSAALGVTINEFYDWCIEEHRTEKPVSDDYSLAIGKTRFADVYCMTREANISLAKRNIVDSIYRAARLEGLGVTFAQTAEIYNGASVKGVAVDEIVAVNNLKHAWQFIFETVDYPMDILYLRQINKEVGAGLIHNAGNIRTGVVSMGGTEWVPEVPDYDTVSNRMQTILQSDRTVTDKAITMFLYLCRQQPFFDGNKRTATIAANQILIANGKGIFSIPEKLDEQFKMLLVSYYETNDMEDVKQFLYANCLDGYTITKASSQPKLERDAFYSER